MVVSEPQSFRRVREQQGRVDFPLVGEQPLLSDLCWRFLDRAEAGALKSLSQIPMNQEFCPRGYICSSASRQGANSAQPLQLIVTTGLAKADCGTQV